MQPVPAPPRKRASRKVRVRDRGVRLRNRDVDVLFALARMRLLSTSQLTQLFFGAKGTCQKRLRKLFDAGLVRAITTDLAKENRYTLTPLGQSFLEDAIPDAHLPQYRIRLHPDRRGLLHHDLLIDIWIAVALGAEKHQVELLRFEPDWDLRAKDPHAELVPDALVELSQGIRRWHLAIEADAGTEAPGVIVGRKLEKYARHRKDGLSLFGMSRPLVLLVARTERRAHTLARQAQGDRGDSVVLSWLEMIKLNGGLISGLAYPTDFRSESGSEAVTLFSRGLLNPNGTARLANDLGTVLASAHRATIRNSRAFPNSTSR